MRVYGLVAVVVVAQCALYVHGLQLGAGAFLNEDDVYRRNFVEDELDDEDSNHRSTKIHSATTSPEDSKERFRLLLEKIDKDDDEQVSVAELKDWVQRSHTLLPKLIAEERFNSSDSDGDGLVSWQEHIKDTFDLDGDDNIPKRLKGNYENKKRTIKKIAEDKDLFETADLDKDGFIGRDEYYYFNLPEDSEDLVPLLIKHSIGDRDQDGDGQLTFEEYIKPGNTHHDDPHPAQAREEFDNIIDKNSDGVLDHDELRRFFLPSSFKMVMEEIEHLIEEVDKDDDDHLSFDEMMAYHDVFKRSSVTAYGSHLDNIHDLRDEL